MISKTQTPLPTAQIAVLIITRLAEPISYTVIFPFINQMVEELGVTDNPDRVGFYSGLVEAVFSFVQFFTVYHWAKLSDRIGRKPVIFIGLAGVAFSGSLFGLSTTFWFMIIVRCMSGALNGNVAVIKAAIGDITDDTNSTDAFALYGLTWTVGSIVGNAMGGYLSHPYERFPSLFHSWTLFKSYPYLLPCLVAATLTLLGIVFCQIYYTESLPAIADGRRSSKSISLRNIGHRRSSSVISDSDTLVDPSTESLLAKSPHSPDSLDISTDEPKEWGFWDLMAYKPVQILSVTMFMNSFVGGAWAAGSLLFFFDRHNGLSMSPAAIGTASALNGLWTVVAQLTLLGRIRRWLGISKAYKALTFGWIIVWLLLPNLRTLLEWSETPLPRADPYDPILYPATRGWITSIGVNLMLSFVTFVGLSNSLLMVLINFSSPDRTALGAVNGMSTAVGCMARVLGPSIISALFAVSMDGKVLGGRLWWIFMVIMSTANFVTCLFVSPDGDPRRKGDEEAASTVR